MSFWARAQFESIATVETTTWLFSGKNSTVSFNIWKAYERRSALRMPTGILLFRQLCGSIKCGFFFLVLSFNLFRYLSASDPHQIRTRAGYRSFMHRRKTRRLMVRASLDRCPLQLIMKRKFCTPLTRFLVTFSKRFRSRTARSVLWRRRTTGSRVSRNTSTSRNPSYG